MVYLFQTFALGGLPFFDGVEKMKNMGKIPSCVINIMYFEESHHYKPILNMIGASGFENYCEFCNRGYHAAVHKCTKKCAKCFSSPLCLPRGKAIACPQCSRTFVNELCFANHEKMCAIRATIKIFFTFCIRLTEIFKELNPRCVHRIQTIRELSKTK